MECVMPSDEQLKSFYIQWFEENYGMKPVITSSTGLPAVAFAQAVLNRYGLQPEAVDAD
jgi:S-formylglutathione hydrolase FrmB